MTNKDQFQELEALTTRVHKLERAVGEVIDVLKEEMEKTDAYGLFKRLNKWLTLDAMKKRLDDAKELIGSGN